MAYQMIHMEIAYQLLQRMGRMNCGADFILGSVAPDSVHMNPDYRVSEKVRSHLFAGCGEWSDTQDYERWSRNMLQFWENYGSTLQSQEERAFAAGVCVHCFTDYCNDQRIWRRLQREKLPNMSFTHFCEIYYPEAKGIDQWLYQHSEHRDRIRKLLQEGHPFELNGLLHAEEIRCQQHHLLYEQYEMASVDISEYQFLSEKSMMEFIAETVQRIISNRKSFSRI